MNHAQLTECYLFYISAVGYLIGGGLLGWVALKLVWKVLCQIYGMAFVVAALREKSLRKPLPDCISKGVSE